MSGMEGKRLSILIFVVVAAIMLPLLAVAINITVPSAPGSGYFLNSTSTGAYTVVPSSTFYLSSSTGYLGIGTSAPGTNLDVFHSNLPVGDTGVIRISGSTAYGEGGEALDFYNANNNYVMSQIAAEPGGAYVSPLFKIRVANASSVLQDVLAINKNGYVGIGTTVPQAVLQTASAAKTYNSVNNQYDSNVEIQGTYSGRTIGTGAALGFVVPANTDGSNPWEQGRILVTPGNTNNGDATGQMYLQVRADNGGWRWQNDLVLTASGNVGINTTAPTNSLTVAGNANITGSITASTAQFSGISNTGNITSTTETVTTSTIQNLVLPNILNSFLATDGSGNVIANTPVTSFNTQTGAATYSLTSGTGISVSNTNLGATVSNTGVTSFNGSTGAVTANVPTIATTTKGIFDAAPSTSTPDIMFYSETPYTIKRVDCVNSPVAGNTFTFSLIASSSVQSTATTTVMNGMTCNSTSTIQSTTTFNNASIPANSIIQVNYSSASTTGAYVDIKY